MPAEVFIRVRGQEHVAERLQQLGSSDLTRELHERIATRIHAWIEANIAAGGLEKKWAPLQPSTVYAKRMSNKGSRTPQPLAGLTKYLSHTATATEARIGFSTKLAVFHQWGTHGPYEITPRFKRALAFPSLWTRSYARQTLGSRNFARLFRGPGGTPRRPAFASRLGAALVRRLWLTPGQGTRPGAMRRMTTFQQAARSRADFSRLNFMVVQKVTHPGLPARPLFPSSRMTRQLTNEVTRNYIREVLQR